MTDPGNILMVIPARGGSKRLPRKNVLPLGGKPLICWSIEAALGTGIDARILVTSDDDEILGIARQYESQGVIAHKRSDQLASDIASSTDVVIDAVRSEQKAGFPPETIVLLQPTSPLRGAEDIVNALEVFRGGDCKDTVVSVCEVDHPTAWVGTIDNDAVLKGIDLSGKRSQDYQREYRLNGAVYVAHTDALLTNRSLFTNELRASVMPRNRSFDIDEEIDLLVCETFLNTVL